MTAWKNNVPKIAAELAASLISADGVIEEEEKAIAIAVGQRLLPSFSKAMFEEVLKELDSLPSAYEIAHPLRKKLDEEDRDLIMDYLVAIANADREIVEVEAEELKAVADALGVPMPPFKVVQPEMPA